MSYLICLYVYYHGNNLSAFGFDPGKAPVGELHEGLQRDSSALDFEGLLPDDVVKSMAASEKMSSAMNYEEIFRQALADAQDSTKKLLNSSLNVSSGTSTKDDFDLGEDDGVIGMDFFDEMNGLGSYRSTNSGWTY